MDDEFSAHADAAELRRLAAPRCRSAPETVYVVHGEPAAAAALAQRIRDELDWCAVVPRWRESVGVD